MNIRERMASKQLFSDDDANYPKEAAELAKARQRGKALCYEINNLHPDDVEMRNTLMKQLFGSMGKMCGWSRHFGCPMAQIRP